MLISVEFDGFNGTTGLIGDSTWTRVMVLAPTIIELQISGTKIAGENVTFSGTILDEHGQLLTDEGILSGGVIHLWIDGVDVGSTYTTISNSSTGSWEITYNLPLDTDYGVHIVSKFYGGFTWVDLWVKGTVNLNFIYLHRVALNLMSPKPLKLF